MARANRTTRRSFLRHVGAAGAAAAALPGALRSASPNEKLRIACIGVGGMGWADSHAVARSRRASIAALCDIDGATLERAAKEFPGAATFADWRELLAKAGDSIDAVTCSTPDHMHAPITSSALRLGKHVYCQKPLTHDVYEARRIALAAREAKVVTQMGIQLSSGVTDRAAVQMLRAGAIGKVKEVHLWSNKPTERYRPAGPRPERQDPVPDHVKWDLWLGTAPTRPFVLDTYHPTWWRGWQDFGVGWLGDMGCHIFSAAYAALKLAPPLRIAAEVEPEWAANPARRAETWPIWQIVRYQFPGNELTAGKVISVTWSDGYTYPPDSVKKVLEGQDFPQQGALFIGEEGALLLPHVAEVKLFPAEKFKAYERPRLDPVDHYLSWVDACAGEGTTAANFDYSGPLAEIVLLGTAALRCPGRTLEWDAKNLAVTNLPEANRFLRRRYRSGWETPGL